MNIFVCAGSQVRREDPVSQAREVVKETLMTVTTIYTAKHIDFSSNDGDVHVMNQPTSHPHLICKSYPGSHKNSYFVLLEL